jgi:hypothetical protein
MARASCECLCVCVTMLWASFMFYCAGMNQVFEDSRRALRDLRQYDFVFLPATRCYSNLASKLNYKQMFRWMRVTESTSKMRVTRCYSNLVWTRSKCFSENLIYPLHTVRVYYHVIHRIDSDRDRIRVLYSKSLSCLILQVDSLYFYIYSPKRLNNTSIIFRQSLSLSLSFYTYYWAITHFEKNFNHSF